MTRAELVAEVGRLVRQKVRTPADCDPVTDRIISLLDGYIAETVEATCAAVASEAERLMQEKLGRK